MVSFYTAANMSTETSKSLNEQEEEQTTEPTEIPVNIDSKIRKTEKSKKQNEEISKR